jgi:hypothetical protein
MTLNSGETDDPRFRVFLIFYETPGGGSSAFIKTGKRLKLRFTNHGHSMGQTNR